MRKSNRNTISRRNFIKTCAAATTIGGATALLFPGCSGNMTSALGRKSIIGEEANILFQGDSITDAGRNKGGEDNANDSAALGKGYVYLIAAQLLADRSGDNLKVYNRGISGNKVFQLANRWDEDCLQLQPDLLSILMGCKVVPRL